MIGDALKLIWNYEDNVIKGHPIWTDRTFIASAVALAATILLKYAGLNMDADLQAAVVTVIVGIVQLTKGHVGIVKAEKIQPSAQSNPDPYSFPEHKGD